jgi:hypothetical protein
MPLTSRDIPITAPVTLARLQQTHAQLHLTPNDDPTLSFVLALPKDWVYSKQFGPVPGGLFQARGLGFFTGSLEPGAPVVAVTVTPLPFEVPVDSWASLALEHEGWEIVANQWFPGPNGLFFDLTGVRTADGRELVRRTTARVDGSNIFSVNTICAREHWEAAKHDFWTAHVTFDLLGGSGTTQMEAWVRTRAASPDFETVHPMSWQSEQAEVNADDASGVHIRLTDAEHRTLLAYMLVRAVRTLNKEPSSLVRLFGDTIAMLEKSGLQLTRDLRPQSDEEDPRGLGIKGWLCGFVGEGHLGEANIAVRVGFIEREQVVLTLVLYAPKVEDDLLIALRAQRAFEIARGGLLLLR